ncbi:MAG: FAD-dependent oxidoreductase [Opitutaceae bacterium]
MTAARGGARTVLVERHGFCGGMATAAGVSVFINYRDTSGDLSDSVYREIIAGLDAKNAHYRTDDAHCDVLEPEALKHILDDKLAEVGVSVYFYLYPVEIESRGTAGWSVICQGKNAHVKIGARCVIDATGDADVCARAGVSTTHGRRGDGRPQPMTMMVRLGRFDAEIYRASGRPLTAAGHALEGGSRSDEIALARQRGEWSIARDDIAMFWTHPWDRSQVSINATRVLGPSMPSYADLSNAEIEGRRQAWEVWRFFKKYIPGFSDSVLLTTGPQIGVRESRRIVGITTLTENDVIGRRTPPDSIAYCAYPIDIHSPDGERDTFDLAQSRRYGIPLGCLIPVGHDWLLAAGRCISASHEAAASFRVMPTCYSIGQAAGAAAVISIRENIPPRMLDGATVRGFMEQK